MISDPEAINIAERITSDVFAHQSITLEPESYLGALSTEDWLRVAVVIAGLARSLTVALSEQLDVPEPDEPSEASRSEQAAALVRGLFDMMRK